MISQYFDPTNRPSFSTSSWPKLWEWVWDIPQVFTRSLSPMITRVRQQTNGLSVTVGQITEWFWNWITNFVIFMIWLVVATLMNWSEWEMDTFYLELGVAHFWRVHYARCCYNLLASVSTAFKFWLNMAQNKKGWLLPAFIENAEILSRIWDNSLLKHGQDIAYCLKVHSRWMASTDLGYSTTIFGV